MSLSILRIGGPIGTETAVEIIQTQLLSHFQKASNSSSTPSTSSVGNLLSFSNKYFDAKVQLQPILIQTTDECHSVPNNDCKNNEIGIEDGIILIFPHDATNETFTSFQNEIESKCCSNSMYSIGDTIRLCITILSSNNNNYGEENNPSSSSLSNKQKEEIYSNRVLWCLDHGYEYIEVDISEHGLTTGFDCREKDGFARVVEAIQGTVWSSAVMKRKSGGVSNKSIASTSTTDAAAIATAAATTASTTTTVKHDTDKANQLDKEIQDQKEMDSTNKNNDDSDENKEIKPKQNPTTEQQEQPSNKNPYKQNNHNEQNKNVEIDEKKEEIMDDIERVMKEASKLRKQAQSGEMSDEDRRKRAGDAATMLMSLLDEIGFDDEDDEDEDSVE